MKEFFNTIKKDSVLFWSYWATVSILILTLLASIAAYVTLPPFLPLYNHLPWGYARLGRTYEIFIPTLTALFLFILDCVIGMRLLIKSPLLVRFLFLTMTITAVFTCIFVMRLILITL